MKITSIPESFTCSLTFIRNYVRKVAHIIRMTPLELVNSTTQYREIK